MKYCTLLLVVLATVVGGTGAEVVECHSRFQFRNKYVFNYTGTTKTGVVGTNDVTSDIRIACSDVVISVPKKCLLVLSTNNCEITPATDQTRALIDDLELYELVAYVQNGLITKLTPHVDEGMEVLNIKRGILSALQMEWTGSLQEELVSDQLSIHGNCSTNTTHVHHDDASTEEMLVTRDLNSCSHKSVKTPLLWSGLSYLQNMNIGSKMINSSQQCRINGLNRQRVECTEIHSFWPMGISSDHGLITTITQVLERSELEGMNSLVFDAQRYITRYTNIIQEIPDVESHEELSVDKAMAYIRDLVKSTLDEVKMDTPRKFGNWVKALRSLNNDTIHEVFEKTYYCEEHAESCANTVGKPELAREYLWDGLFQCGTLPCFSVVNTAIMTNIIPEPLAYVMMYTMTFWDYPTLGIITEGVRLAQVKRTRSIFLSVSTMIYKYWVHHPEIHNERDLPDAMRTFIELLNNIINNDCSLTSGISSVEAVEEERQILLAIKSLGNIGPVAQKYDETSIERTFHFERELMKCAINDEISLNISLNAVHALRRFTLSTVVITNLKMIFRNASLDVEIRTAAYLIYMKSDVVASEFTDVYQSLKDEPVKQFKDFAFSHISNILESEDPSVQRLRGKLFQAIGQIEFPNIFQYSRNIEISKNLTCPYLNQTFNGYIESNIIYNPNAIMPKSLMLKYALNARGKNWELIETGLDVQGFEVILESVFGPSGQMPVTEPMPEIMLDSNIQENLDNMHDVVNKEQKELLAAIYLRVLGNELGYLTLDDLKSLIPVIDEQMLVDMVKKIGSGGIVDLNTTRSILFLERELLLPTGLGMPLNLSTMGSAVMSVRTRGQLSIQLQSATFSGRLAPSAAVEIIGTMGVHIPTTQIHAGVMANASVYHSSKIEGSVTINNTTLKVKLEALEKPMNLLNFSTNYFLLKPDGEMTFLPGIMEDAVKYERCANPGKLLGASLCMSFAYPNASYFEIAPRFPLTGLLSFNITLNNTDQTIGAHSFEAEFNDITLLNRTYKYDRNDSNGIKKTYRYMDVHRGDYSLFYQEDGEKEIASSNMSRNYTFGLKATQKVLKKGFAGIGNDVLDTYVEEEYDIKPVNLNTTLHFYFNNENTVLHSYLTALDLTVSIPKSMDLTYQTRWEVGLFEDVLQLNNTASYLLMMEGMRAVFNWTEFKENVTMKYQKAREYAKEKYSVLIKANSTRAITEVEEITNTIKTQLKQYQRELLPTVAKLLDITDLSPVIKPWLYTGMIFGDAHVMTFDGRVYEFPAYRDADCTYVLARDFVDGNFTLLVKELSTTLVLDSCTVTIDDKGLFFINGNQEPQSPPYVSSNRDVIVTRDGPWINVTTTYGIQLNCHEENFMCIYTLSGWYYSQTQGLLGNLDKEHSNDFIKPDGTIAPHLNDFANSYEVSGLSVCQIPLVEVEPEEPSCNTADSKKAECEALFNNKSSHLMPIFDTINPQPFLVACKENAEKCKHVDMVNPYINLARVEGVFVDIPGCADPTLTEHCTYDRPSVTAADIVFIISENWNMTKNISENDLKINLKNLYVKIIGFESSFALVAYGGSEYEHCAPHLHSNELELYTNGNFERVVDSLEFCDESCSCSPGKGDALQALKYATQLPLRDNAGKIFILIDADDDKEYLPTDRLEAANILSSNGITVNVISDYTRWKKSRIGVNYDGLALFNKKNIDVGVPLTAYAQLAKKTLGAVINIDHLKNDKKTAKYLGKDMGKLFGVQLMVYKSGVCTSVRDYYGRPSSLCEK